MNKVILMGRLTRDPEIQNTANELSFTNFSIAVNRRFAKEGQQQADFINCTAWRKTAEFISNYFHKGSMIAVVGQLRSRSWDGQDGKKQYAMDVVVDEAYFTGSRAQTNTSNTFTQQTVNSTTETGGDDYNGFTDIDGSEDDLPF